MSRSVTTPYGEEWTVRRAWVPRLGRQTLWGRFAARMRRIRNRAKDAGDLDPGCLDGCAGVDGLEAIGIVLAVVLVVALLVLFVVPLLVALVDVLILLLLGLIALVVRVVFRRPWVVEAHRTDVDDDDTSFDARWSVVGWRESGERVEQVAQHLEAGLGLPPTDT